MYTWGLELSALYSLTTNGGNPTFVIYRYKTGKLQGSQGELFIGQELYWYVLLVDTSLLLFTPTPLTFTALNIRDNGDI